MTFNELRSVIAADQFRYEGGVGWKNFFQEWFRESGFRFTVVMRCCTFLRAQWWSRWGIYHLFRCWHRLQQVKYSTYISFESKIGPGLYLGHLCCIVMNTRAEIGRDCTLSHGVTIGQTNSRSKNPGCPIIGDRVYLGCGAAILGAITVGNDSVIAPNSVVIHDVPPRTVVSGIPARTISEKGSSGYVAFPSRLPP
jgi:serine O-acetyltransferase